MTVTSSCQECSYPAGVDELHHEFEPQPWGEDATLVEVLGARGADGFRALLEGFPEAVGLLWAIRGPAGAIVDFAFGYGNPAMMRGFRIPPETAERYTLLEALAPMRDSRAFRSYVEVCDTGAPFVNEVTYDTPFGDGYMLGTFLHRVAGSATADRVPPRRHRRAADGSGAEGVCGRRRARPQLASGGHRAAGHPPRAEPEQPPAGDVLVELRASTRRALDLVDGVLDYARSGELALERVALGDMMAEVATDLRHALERRRRDAGGGRAAGGAGDPRQLRRVMQNLVGNALKFRREEAPRVEISALEGSREWVVTVRDNGIGIDRDDASRIFGMFSRVERRVEGSGIGLAVCRRVVEAHGGTSGWSPRTAAGAPSASRCRTRRSSTIRVGACRSGYPRTTSRRSSRRPTPCR